MTKCLWIFLDHHALHADSGRKQATKFRATAKLALQRMAGPAGRPVPPACPRGKFSRAYMGGCALSTAPALRLPFGGWGRGERVRPSSWCLRGGLARADHDFCPDTGAVR